MIRVKVFYKTKSIVEGNIEGHKRLFVKGYKEQPKRDYDGHMH